MKRIIWLLLCLSVTAPSFAQAGVRSGGYIGISIGTGSGTHRHYRRAHRVVRHRVVRHRHVIYRQRRVVRNGRVVYRQQRIVRYYR